MKKVLLIGELNKTVSNLNRYLANSFRTQVCADSLELVRGMVKVSTPDLVLVCLVGVGELDQKILDFFKDMDQKIPVLLVGKEEECRYYSQYYDAGQFTYVVRPVTQSTLLTRCRQILGLASVEAPANDDWGIEVHERLKRQILLVDDSPLALRSIKAMLDAKYDVVVATSGEKALATAKKELPDLVVLDYEMPGWDGRRTLEELRKDEEVGDIPVVFLTGVADKEHIAAVLGMNPQGYLLKPVDKDKLLNTIKKVFGE